MRAIPTNSQRHAPECAHAVDSLPVPVCVNIRIRRCRLYPLKEPGANEFRGYVPSKRRYFYRLRVHLVVTGAGEPVEFALAAGFEVRRGGQFLVVFLSNGSAVASISWARKMREIVYVLSKADRSRLGV
jgi:hypothetical protein